MKPKTLMDKLAEFWPLIAVIIGSLVGYLHNQWSSSNLASSFTAYTAEAGKTFHEQDKEMDDLKVTIAQLQEYVDLDKMGKIKH